MLMKKIDEANYCNNDNECVNIGAICPFGCSIYVNHNEVDNIKQIINKFRKIKKNNCEYMCGIIPGDIKCINNKCKFVENITKTG